MSGLNVDIAHLKPYNPLRQDVTPLKTNMTLKNHHFQYETMVDFPLSIAMLVFFWGVVLCSVHPWKLTAGNLKSPICKGKSSSKPPWLWVQNVNFPRCIHQSPTVATSHSHNLSKLRCLDPPPANIPSVVGGWFLTVKSRSVFCWGRVWPVDRCMGQIFQNSWICDSSMLGNSSNFFFPNWWLDGDLPW